MLRRPLTTGLGLLALLLAGFGQAADEYWVSVGSYRTVETAEVARGQASERLSESFGVSEANLASGRWYRVIAGPYLSAEIAEHIREEAVRSGFENAWVLAMDSPFVADPGMTTYPDDDYRFDSYSFDDSGTTYSSEGYAPETPRGSVPASEPADIPGFNAPIREEREKEHKLISEPPEGYQLHELNRDQATLDFSSPFLLASKAHS